MHLLVLLDLILEVCNQKWGHRSKTAASRIVACFLVLFAGSIWADCDSRMLFEHMGSTQECARVCLIQRERKMSVVSGDYNPTQSKPVTNPLLHASSAAAASTDDWHTMRRPQADPISQRVGLEFNRDGVAVLPEFAELFVHLTNTSGTIWDFDDNLFDSDPWVHSNPRPGIGRYATLIAEMTSNAGTVSPYNESHWDSFQFAACLGMETRYDLQRLIPAVNMAYSGLDLQCSDAYRLIADVHQRLLVIWQNCVQPIPGAIEAVERCWNIRRPMAIGSAGPGVVVMGLLEKHGMTDKFCAFVTDTPKKTPDGYVGDAALEACKRMSVAPQSAIMIGDSVSDVMTAAHAGIEYVLIRVAGKDLAERDQRISRYVAEFKNQNQMANRELVGPGATKVIFMHHFKQARFELTNNPALAFETTNHANS